MRIVGVAHRIVRWPIEARGAARRWNEREAVLFAVRADSGATGLGEAAPLPGMSIDTVADAEAAAGLLAARLPVELDTPAHASAIADRITTAPAARFAIETALLSAYAQHARTSIAALLARPTPQAELESAIVVDDEAEAFAAALAGVHCAKIKVAGASTAVARIRRIHRAAPALRLRIDANRAWSRDEATDVLGELTELPVDFVEEPCFDAHELLQQPLPCPIALDESLIDLAPVDLERALESPSLAAIMLKPTLLGGFRRCLDLAAQAHQHGVAPIVTHTLEGPIGFAACHELARAVGADVPVGLGPHSASRGAYR